MGVQYEQHGFELSFLQAQIVASTESWGPISTKTPSFSSSVTGPPTADRWLDRWAPNVKNMLTSMIPNTVKTAQHLRLNTLAVLKNFSALANCLSHKGYPREWWKHLFLSSADRWGLKELAVGCISKPLPPDYFDVQLRQLSHCTRRLPRE